MDGPGASANGTGKERDNRIAVFWLEVLYLLILAVLAWAYFTPTAPPELRAPGSFGPIPSGVIWFGALGGVLISLHGVHTHRNNWEPRYWTWHLIRPFVGAAVGVVAVIIVMAGILAIGVEPSSDVATKDLLYFLIAFVVGYREMHFRDMIKRLGDVIFTSEDTTPTAAIVGLDPDEGPAAGGTAVTVTGSGFDGASAVRFGSVDAVFEVVSDTQILATSPAGAVGPVPVTVVTSNGTAGGVKFTYV